MSNDFPRLTLTDALGDGDPLLDAARAAGVQVITTPPDDIDPTAVQMVPADAPCVGVGFADGYLLVAWATVPSPAELDAVEASIGTPVRVVLATAEVVGILRAQATTHFSAHRPSIERVLDAATSLGASDIHLLVGSPPMIRHAGLLTALEGWPILNAHDLDDMARYLGGELAFGPDYTGDADLAASYGGWRYRVSLFRARDVLSIVLRIIPTQVPDFPSLGLPAVIESFAHLKRGLVLVCGPTGSGKSTTLASLVDQVNRTERRHIVTVEDPIEFVHASRQSVVRQREIGRDTDSFSSGLRAVLRQDPDVVLVGEMRDLETIQIALRAAETGHLVLSTLHSRTAESTIERIVDVFPASQQNQIRTQLAGVLEAVVCQTLIPAADNPGHRHAVCEVMVVTTAVRNMIRSGNQHQIPTALQSEQDRGMQSFDLGLAKAVAASQITVEDARPWADSQQSFDDYLQRLRTTTRGIDPDFDGGLNFAPPRPKPE